MDWTSILDGLYARSARAAALALVIGMALLAGHTPAGAQAGDASVREACRADYQRFCANVAVGGGRVRQCMMDNVDKLTPQCRDALASRKAHK